MLQDERGRVFIPIQASTGEWVLLDVSRWRELSHLAECGLEWMNDDEADSVLRTHAATIAEVGQWHHVPKQKTVALSAALQCALLADWFGPQDISADTAEFVLAFIEDLTGPGSVLTLRALRPSRDRYQAWREGHGDPTEPRISPLIRLQIDDEEFGR